GGASAFQAEGRGFEARLPLFCDVSGHRRHMSHDIADDSRWPGGGSEGLIVTGGVDGEAADELAIEGDDADVLVRDEQRHLLVIEGGAQADVVQTAEIAEGDPA